MEMDEEVRLLSSDAVDLLVNVGIMTSVSDQWPPHVQAAWLARVHTLRGFMQGQIAEVHQFAEAYD